MLIIKKIIKATSRALGVKKCRFILSIFSLLLLLNSSIVIADTQLPFNPEIQGWIFTNHENTDVNCAIPSASANGEIDLTRYGIIINMTNLQGVFVRHFDIVNGGTVINVPSGYTLHIVVPPQFIDLWQGTYLTIFLSKTPFQIGMSMYFNDHPENIFPIRDGTL